MTYDMVLYHDPLAPHQGRTSTHHGSRTPEQERRRVRALYEYHIMDSLPETSYDDIVELASELTGAPVAFLAFVDTQRIWVKSSCNLPIAQLSFEEGPCQLAVAQDAAFFSISDMRADARTSHLGIAKDFVTYMSP